MNADKPAKRVPIKRRERHHLNLGRRSNVEALVIHMVGDEAAKPCFHCNKGDGPWKYCIVKKGELNGACTNCWFNASGVRCTFHGKLSFPLFHPCRLSICLW